jgi:hypothetical protein
MKEATTPRLTAHLEALDRRAPLEAAEAGTAEPQKRFPSDSYASAKNAGLSRGSFDSHGTQCVHLQKLEVQLLQQGRRLRVWPGGCRLV